MNTKAQQSTPQESISCGLRMDHHTQRLQQEYETMYGDPDRVKIAITYIFIAIVLGVGIGWLLMKGV